MADVQQLKGAKEALTKLIQERKCNPIMIRLAWHDSGTYDASVTEPWPAQGGANGSIRFKKECSHCANAGLIKAINMIESIKEQFPKVSYADLFQMASALSVELTGGPKIPMRYGREDTSHEDGCPKEGNLPAGGPPYPTGGDAAGHLRAVFHRMAMTDQEIVALSGAHTLGRAYKDRSGFGADQTKYTKDPVAPGATVGGSSWTKEWLKFDNSYFHEIKEQNDKELLVLDTDAVIFKDPKFRPYAEKYAADQDLFFVDYAAAHAKLSELGSRWAGGKPVTID